MPFIPEKAADWK